MQGKRLGQSYGFDVIKLKSSIIEELSGTVKVLESVAGPVDAIAVICGINDIKYKDPKTVVESLVKSLREILNEHPKTKIVVSKIPPVKESGFVAKREPFSALFFVGARRLFCGP